MKPRDFKFEYDRAADAAYLTLARDNERKIGRPPLFDKLSYGRRAAIENCVGWLKECRRIVTRFEKLAVSYLGMLKLAMIERYLRLLEFSDRA